MKFKFLLAIICFILPLISSANPVRVTSLSMLNQSGYVYEIARDGPSIYGTWAVNMNHPSNGANVFMWDNTSDDDQLFQLVGKLIKRKAPYNGNYYCLNAYNPNQMSNVNSYKCDAGDSDQNWSYTMVGSYSEYVMIEANNSGYCLNSHNPYYYSDLNLYACDTSDQDQWFAIFRSEPYL